MKALVLSILAIPLFAAAALAGDLAAESAEERSRDTREIREHIDSIFQAYIGKDRDAIRATHSEEWRGFLRPSTTVVKGIDAYMNAAEAALSGPYGLSGYEFVEYDTIFYGDTAIVNYIAELEPGRPSPIRPLLRVLDVYARLDGHWIQVASQATYHPDTAAALARQAAPAAENP